MTAAGTDGRRTLVWGALVLFVGAPIAVAALTAFNLVRSSELSAHASEQEVPLRQIERRIETGAADGGAGATDVSAIYLNAASGTLARAELQQLIVNMIGRSSGRVIEARGSDDDSQQEDNRQVKLQVTLDATNESLFNLLYEIETGVPILAVEQISIRKLPSRTGGPENDPALRVSLVVRGYWSGAPK
jgi:hypothetical protein